MSAQLNLPMILPDSPIPAMLHTSCECLDEVIELRGWLFGFQFVVVGNPELGFQER